MRRQNIVADGGYAYGAIDGDVHIMDRAAPRHLVAPNLGSTSRAGVDPTVMSSLTAWLVEENRLAVRWLYGNGSSGLAAADALSDESHARGWDALTVVPREEARARPVPAWRHDDVLLVVESAHQWQTGDLTWLLSDGALQRPGRTRVLLLASSTDRWPRLRASLAHVLASLSSQPV